MLKKLKVMGVLLLFIPLWGFNSMNFHGSFHMLIDEGSFLQCFLITNELRIN
jgi:hypothetical protein